MNPSLRSALAELGRWTVPGGVLLGSALLWIHYAAGTPVLREVTEGYPLVVFGASLLLAWRLRRSRVGGAVLRRRGVHPDLPGDRAGARRLPPRVRAGGRGERPLRHPGPRTEEEGSRPSEEAREPRTVLERADEALYRAKKKGRNRVERA